MSFLNHLKQRSASHQGLDSNDLSPAIRRSRVPARLLLNSNSYTPTLSSPLSAPFNKADRSQLSPYAVVPPSQLTAGNRPASACERPDTLPNRQTWESLRREYMQADVNQSNFSVPETPTSPAFMDVPQPCRTVYLGNIPPDTAPSLVLDKVRCGAIEAYRSLPEKGCAFIAFLDAQDAAVFHREANQSPTAGRRLLINGQEIRVAWGKPSPVPQHVQREINDHHASRNVFLGDIDPKVDTEEKIRERFENFGQIDTVRILSDKRIAFIHMCNITDAIRAVRELSHDREWQGRRVNYGRDRCAPVANPTTASLRKMESEVSPIPISIRPAPGLPAPDQPQVLQPQPQVDTNALVQRLAAVALRAGISPSYALLAAATANNPQPPGADPQQRVTPLARSRSMSAARLADDLRARLDSPGIPGIHSPAYPESLPRTPTSAHGFGFSGVESPMISTPGIEGQSRTVYLGNLHADTTLEDLCNVIRGGGLEEIKIFLDRGIAFVTFLEAEAAASFLTRVQRDGMTVRHRKLKAGWGRATPILSPQVRDAVLYSGASRNVYIGGLPEVDPSVDASEDPWSVEKIKADFEVFGEIEMANRPSGMDCAFVNFSRIQSAIRAVDEMNSGTGVGGGVMRRYEGLRVNYGKDRCANAPRIIKNPSVPPSPSPMLPPPSPLGNLRPSPQASPQPAPTTNLQILNEVKPWAQVSRSVSTGATELANPAPTRKLSLDPGREFSGTKLPSGAVVTATTQKSEEPRTSGGRYEVPHRRSRAATTGMWDASRAGTLAANGVNGRVAW